MFFCIRIGQDWSRLQIALMVKCGADTEAMEPGFWFDCKGKGQQCTNERRSNQGCTYQKTNSSPIYPGRLLFFNILKPDNSWARKAILKDLKSKKYIEEALLYRGFMVSNIN